VSAVDVRDARLPSGGADPAARSPQSVGTGRGPGRRGLAAWYGGFTAYSVAVALLAGGDDAIWGRWAAGGYALAAVLALCGRRPRLAALPALAGALAAPMARLMLAAPPTADISAVTRAASLMLRHGNPYLPLAQLGSWRAYNPYLPGMALFGLPHVAGLPGAAGDPRLWLTMVTACVLGAACAMKITAWPALPVFTAMLAAREGTRSAARFAATATAATGAVMLATAPALVTSARSLLANTVLFPLGMTRHKTPAASPLPGHLLAATGPAGHLAAMALLGAAGIAVAVSLFRRPPRDAGAAALRLAVGLALLFTLAPDARFGYFAYPAALAGWAWVVSPAPAGRCAAPAPRRRTEPAGSCPSPAR
jgi:hypothetical protein